MCLKSLVFFTIFIQIFVNCCEDSIDYHLGTKTPYRFVGNKNNSKITYEGCKPLKVWMLVRHGTRNPSAEYIDIMKTRLPIIKKLIINNNNDLMKSELSLLDKWRPSVDVEDEKLLAHEGTNEMIELAERMQSRFPECLPSVYSNTSYEFKFTHTKRTKSSAIHFAVGLFGRPTAKDVWYPEPSTRDPILRFYKLCNKWRKEVKKNPEALKELFKFKNTKIASNAVLKIEKKLGLPSKTIKFEDLQYMYTTCAFETAWNRKKKSPWCSLFDLETIKILEYAEDLKYYWVDGYGYDITYKQACPAFSHMFNYHETTETYPKATLYFTHSGTLLKMLAHLGLYKDETPLLHNNYNRNRKWRVSKIDPFGTNLAFVSFKCTNKIKLLMLHQEKIIRFPSCPETDLCELSTLKKDYEDSINSCNFDEMCS